MQRGLSAAFPRQAALQSLCQAAASAAGVRPRSLPPLYRFAYAVDRALRVDRGDTSEPWALVDAWSARGFARQLLINIAALVGANMTPRNKPLVRTDLLVGSYSDCFLGCLPGFAVAVNQNDALIFWFNRATRELSSYSIGATPLGLACDPPRARALVPLLEANALAVLSPTSPPFSVALGIPPASVTIAANANTAIVAARSGDSVAAVKLDSLDVALHTADLLGGSAVYDSTSACIWAITGDHSHLCRLSLLSWSADYFDAGGWVDYVVLCPARGLGACAAGYSDAIAILDLASGALQPLSLPAALINIDADPVSSEVLTLVDSSPTTSIHCISLPSLATRDALAVNGDLHLAHNSARREYYTAGNSTGNVSVFSRDDLSSSSLAQGFPGCFDLYADAESGCLLVQDSTPAHLALFEPQA
jgi:hypothetical protein